MNEDEIRQIVRDEIGKFQRYQNQYFEKPQVTKEEKPGQVITSEQILLSNFPQDLRGKLNVSEVEDEWWITKQYDRTDQGKKEWATVTRVVKVLGGDWVPDSKNSRWQVPK